MLNPPLEMFYQTEIYFLKQSHTSHTQFIETLFIHKALLLQCISNQTAFYIAVNLILTLQKHSHIIMCDSDHKFPSINQQH